MHRMLWLVCVFLVAVVSIHPDLATVQGEQGAVDLATLKLRLKDSDPAVRKQAVSIIGLIGAAKNPAHPNNAGKPVDPERSKITAFVPDLIHVLTDVKEKEDIREAAAAALKDIGSCPELDTEKATNSLISTVRDKANPANVRAMALWPLRFHSEIAKHDKFFALLNEIVEKEPIANDTKLLRYDAAFLLSKYKKKAVSEKVLDTLLEFLKDNQAFILGILAGPGGLPKGADGRIIALNALIFVINDKAGGDATRLTARKDILAQLQVLAGTSKDPAVQKTAKDILDYVK
jgi:hypothetical protein